jgi:hypothetical protein
LTIPVDSFSPGPIHSKSHTLTGLSIATVYEAMILSRNSFGWSKPSAILRFGTAGAGEYNSSAGKPVFYLFFISRDLFPYEIYPHGSTSLVGLDILCEVL